MLVRDLLILQAAAECMADFLPFHIQHAAWREYGPRCESAQHRLSILPDLLYAARLVDHWELEQRLLRDQADMLEALRCGFPPTLSCLICALHDLIDPIERLLYMGEHRINFRRERPLMRRCPEAASAEHGAIVNRYDCDSDERHQMSVRETAVPARSNAPAGIVWEVVLLGSEIEIARFSVSPPSGRVILPVVNEEALRHFQEVVGRIDSVE
jgi:hypothetical protein